MIKAYRFLLRFLGFCTFVIAIILGAGAAEFEGLGAIAWVIFLCAVALFFASTRFEESAE